MQFISSAILQNINKQKKSKRNLGNQIFPNGCRLKGGLVISVKQVLNATPFCFSGSGSTLKSLFYFFNWRGVRKPAPSLLENRGRHCTCRHESAIAVS